MHVVTGMRQHQSIEAADGSVPMTPIRCCLKSIRATPQVKRSTRQHRTPQGFLVQRNVQCAMEAAITDHEQGRQVKDAVAFHQAAIACRRPPAQALDGQLHRGEMAPGPAARRAAFAGEYQQGNPSRASNCRSASRSVSSRDGTLLTSIEREEMDPDHHPCASAPAYSAGALLGQRIRARRAPPQHLHNIVRGGLACNSAGSLGPEQRRKRAQSGENTGEPRPRPLL